MSPERRNDLLGAAAAAAGLAAAVLAAAARGVPFGLPLDDAWIHAAFARNLAESGVWGLVAGTVGGGESSLLWPLLLAPGELGGARAAPLLALVLGAAAFLALPGLAGRLAGEPGRGRVAAVAAGLAGPYLFAALSGMETLPALACGLAALERLVAGRPRAAGLWAGVAILLRPDAVLLLPVLALGLTWRGEARRLPSLGPAAAAAVLALAALSLLESRFPPATLAGRRWIAGLPRAVEPLQAGAGLAALLKDWAAALVADLGGGRAAGAGAAGTAWRAAWALLFAAAAVAGAFRAGSRRIRAARPGPALVALWAAAALLFYAVVLPDRGHAGRYQPQVPLAAILLAVEGVFVLRPARRRLRALAAGGAAVLAAGLLAASATTAVLWGDAVDHVTRLHAAAARDLADRTDADAVVAAFDVGAVAYLRPRPLVDLSGLGGGRGLDALHAGRADAFLLETGATHVLLPFWGEPEGPRSLRGRLGLLDSDLVATPVVATWSRPRSGWARQFALSGNAFPILRLHAVRPAADPGRT